MRKTLCLFSVIFFLASVTFAADMTLLIYSDFEN